MFHNTRKKQLILVRHAHALELSDFKWLDFDRPLSQKWREYAQIVTRYLRLIGVRPDCIIASPAARTRETAEIICEQYRIDHVSLIDDLYRSSAKNWDSNQIHINLIQHTSPDTDTLMLVGHNDDITEFARHLSDDGVPSMKKWSLVILSLPSNMSWENIVPGELSVLYYLTPQFLKLEELI